MKFKAHYGPGEHALIYETLREGVIASTPFRQLRRHILANDVIHTLALSDRINPEIMVENMHGMVTFLHKCQRWFDFKADMYQRFIGNGAGIIH
jgi:hypothetical protein